MSYPLNVKYHGKLWDDGHMDYISHDVFDEFMEWICYQKAIQFDVETPVDYDEEGEPVMGNMREKKLITVQFGSVNQKESVQWVFQWSELTYAAQRCIRFVLETTDIEKLIHNAKFELQVCLNYGIRIRNIYDTMLAEQVIYCGFDGAYTVKSNLEAVSWRRLMYHMDKDLQTSFGNNMITAGKLGYASRDVLVLDKIKNLQLLDLHEFNLEYVAALENESAIGFAQMSWEGMTLNKQKWLENLEWAHPQVIAAEAKCNEWLDKEPFKSRAIKLGIINPEDIVQINWNSNNDRRMIAARLFPGCPGATKAVVQNWAAKQDIELQSLAWDFLDKKSSKSLLMDELLQKHREWLIENELLRPAGTGMINWNSVDQVLPLLQVVDPRLQDMSADSMGKFHHPIGLDIEHYKERLKLITTYGEAFFKHVDPDGNVRTVFGQIKTTGRVGSSKPNMQNITVKDFVGQRYRNCFIPPPGFRFCSSDYVSQELVIIAYITQDKQWLEALRKGQDLHSVASELVFGSPNNPYKISWKQAAEKDCAYYAMTRIEGKLQQAKAKCDCKKHKVMRSACKNINFGLAYGMTEYRLAAMLRISLGEARLLIREYYKAMPAIGTTMTYLGNFGVRNGYIQTLSPFFRRRWFPRWPEKARFVDEHIAGIRSDKTLSAIEKASKNMPIQGASADCTKIALCMIMWEIDVFDLHDKVKVVMQVHDQIDTVVREDFAEEWKMRLTEIMEEAGKVIVTNGLLKAETTITEVWSK